MADEARVQRQKALADKKKRLEELKARRQQRSTTTQVSAHDLAKEKVAASANLDDYIEGLLQAPAAGTPNAVAADTPNGGTAVAPAPKEPEKMTETEEQETAAAAPAPAPVAAPVIKTETFEMGTQTQDDDFPPPSDYDEEEQPPEQTEEKTEEQIVVDEKPEEKVEEEAKTLSAEEVERELASETFSSFLNTASKKVERVLGSAVLADLLLDYDGETDGSKRQLQRRLMEANSYHHARYMNVPSGLLRET